MDVITRTADLEALCQRLAAAEFVTVDTEFLRDNSYYSKLCLIQVADDDGPIAVDPLADGLDLVPFWRLLNDDPVVKVFHACRQDLEIVYHATDTLPEPLFDTQVAAMVCGFGDSVGYETLVAKLADGRLDKTARFTDWSRRPLSDRQLRYALDDVTHLRIIYRKLKAMLDGNGRGPWLDEEMGVLSDPATYRIDPRQAWKRIKTRTNKPRFLGFVREIAAWREEEARQRDMPRNRIAKDEVILELAANPPRQPDDLDKVRGLPKRFGHSRAGRGLMDAVARARGVADTDLPRVPRQNDQSQKAPPVADLLKTLLKVRCQQEGVAPKLIGSAGDMEAIALDDEADVPALKGWRWELFGRDALALKQGRLAIAADGGRIKLIRLDD